MDKNARRVMETTQTRYARRLLHMSSCVMYVPLALLLDMVLKSCELSVVLEPTELTLLDSALTCCKRGQEGEALAYCYCGLACIECRVEASAYYHCGWCKVEASGPVWTQLALQGRGIRTLPLRALQRGMRVRLAVNARWRHPGTATAVKLPLSTDACPAHLPEERVLAPSRREPAHRAGRCLISDRQLDFVWPPARAKRHEPPCDPLNVWRA